MKKICVFDLDGTLVNSLYDLADAMNYALVKNGFEPHEREKYRFMVGNGISSLADRAMVIPKGMATDEQKNRFLLILTNIILNTVLIKLYRMTV